MRTTRERLTGFTVVEALVILVIIVVLAAIFYPVLSPPRTPSRQTQCMSNQKRIALAITMYTQDHNETMPGRTTERTANTGSAWRTAIRHTEFGAPDKLFNCRTGARDGSIVMPSIKTRGPEIGMNANLYAVGLGVIFAPESTILTADANANGIVSPSDFASRHNDKKGLVATFCDGHVEYIVTANLPKDARRVSGALTPALYRPGVPGPATIFLDPMADFSPYLLTGGTGMLLTLQDRAHTTTLAGITLPVSTLAHGDTIVLRIGHVAAGDKPSVAKPESWAAGPVTILDYYRGKPAPGKLPALRYGLAAGNYRVGSYAVIRP